jgi:hypothetical protein
MPDFQSWDLTAFQCFSMPLADEAVFQVLYSLVPVV